MNIPNFQNLAGSQQPPKGRSNVRIAVFTILAVHVVLLGGLLMQGCDRNGAKNKLADIVSPTNSLPPLADSFSNLSTNPAADTNQLSNFAANSTTTGAASNALPTLPSNPATETLTPLPKEPPAAATSEYTIQKGDIFANIAKAKGVSLKALVAANPNVDPRKLKVGQKIQIPAPAAPAPGTVAASDAGSPDAPKSATHVVKAGETLVRIAKQHGTTVKAIQTANGLKTSQIRVGQKLKLPAAKTTLAKADTGAAAKLPASAPGVAAPTNQ
ncbi:MAG: LysM peptidoglycan-binding domain-containing protein [Verrucomicrobia bacterium]|nr:LysM peptidoglycan-binding domain-containing protein [Verrucomicrobiota bacterium]